MSLSTLSNASTTGRIEVINDNFTVQWIIEEFSRLPQGEGGYIFSPIFPTVDERVNCRFAVYPQGKTGDDAGYIAINLRVETREGDENIDLKINGEISIFPSGITQKFRVPITEVSGCNKMIEKSELLKLCGSNDAVTIRCKVEIPWETMNKTRCMEQAIDSQEGRLSQDFRPLFKEAKFSDVTVIVGTQRFPAHKLVLAARSPVLSARFENEGTQENPINEIEIEEMEPAVVESMLEFFYTDEVTNLEELACGLLGAAEKYDVPHLRSICEEFLYRTLTIGNAAEILNHTNLYRSPTLKQHVMEFMAEHLSDVVESEGYEEMKGNYPAALLRELIDSIAGQQQKVKRRRLE